MKVKVKEITRNRSVIEVETRTGTKEIEVLKTTHGHSYNDFADWDISDKEYYDLEELVDDVMKRMSGKSTIDVEW